MQKFYALRRGNEFKIAKTDSEGALFLHDKEGWELGRRPYETHEDAKKAIEEWKDIIGSGAV